MVGVSFRGNPLESHGVPSQPRANVQEFVVRESFYLEHWE
jgi:hypothetical protein